MGGGKSVQEGNSTLHCKDRPFRQGMGGSERVKKERTIITPGGNTNSEIFTITEQKDSSEHQGANLKLLRGFRCAGKKMRRWVVAKDSYKG